MNVWVPVCLEEVAAVGGETKVIRITMTLSSLSVDVIGFTRNISVCLLKQILKCVKREGAQQRWG